MAGREWCGCRGRPLAAGAGPPTRGSPAATRGTHTLRAMPRQWTFPKSAIMAAIIRVVSTHLELLFQPLRGQQQRVWHEGVRRPAAVPQHPHVGMAPRLNTCHRHHRPSHVPGASIEQPHWGGVNVGRTRFQVFSMISSSVQICESEEGAETPTCSCVSVMYRWTARAMGPWSLGCSEPSCAAKAGAFSDACGHVAPCVRGACD